MTRRLPALLIALLLALAAPYAVGEDNETTTDEEPDTEDPSPDATDESSGSDEEDSSGPADETADEPESTEDSSGSGGSEQNADEPDESDETNETDEAAETNETEEMDEPDSSDETDGSDSDDEANETDPEDATDERASEDETEDANETSGEDDVAEDDVSEDEPRPTSPVATSPTAPTQEREDDADDEPDDEREDEADDEFEDEDDGFRTAPNVTLPAAAQVAYDAPAATIRVEAPHVEAPLDTTFDALLEFSDANGNGAYDLGERVVQRLALADLPSAIVPDGAGRIARYALPENGSLELRFRALPDGATKYDVAILDFPFAREDTRVAFGASASAPGGVRVIEVAGEPAVASARGDSLAYLSWVTTVEVDGATAAVGWSVHTSTSETGETAILYWSYPRGDEIVHDPTLGIVDALRETLGDARAFYAGGAAAIALLGLGYVLRRRPGE